MKKVAIITPCMLPVPATKGGAVETLITEILNNNERNEDMDIDVYSMSFSDVNFKHTNVITVENTGIGKTIDRVLDKVYRTFSFCSVSAKRIYDNRIVREFHKRVRDGVKYDAIIVENMMSTAVKISKHSGKSFECPMYFHMHNNIDIYRSPKATRTLHKCGVKFWAVSEYIKGEILNAEPAADVSVLYNGVNTEIFDIKKCSEKGSVREKLGIGSDEIVLQYSGRIIPEKGVDELIEGFGKLCIDAPKLVNNVRLNIIGMNNPSASSYEELVSILASDNDRINLVPRVDANTMADYYAAADIIVVPSMFDEPFGMVALEAIAMGKPVIASNTGGLPEILDVNFSILVNKDNIAVNLENAIGTMIEEGNFGEEGKTAYEHFKARPEFNKDSFYSNFVALIKKE